MKSANQDHKKKKKDQEKKKKILLWNASEFQLTIFNIGDVDQQTVKNFWIAGAPETELVRGRGGPLRPHSPIFFKKKNSNSIHI